MIVLLGHSMGGIVGKVMSIYSALYSLYSFFFFFAGAETILKFVESPHDLLGASIIGMLA